MIVLFNPRSTSPGKQPLPLSLMALAAVLEAREPTEPWVLVDGNLVDDPAGAIEDQLRRLRPNELGVLAVTVMPGPQVTQAVDVCRRLKRAVPGVPILWGGYFPTQHTDTVLQSAYVDYVVRSQGERALIELIDTLKHGGALESISGLSWKSNGRITHNSRGPLVALDALPDPPYARVDMGPYIHRNYLGRRTLAYNSSFGCPFACNFCAVVAMANRRWIAQSPARMERAMRHLTASYGIDAIQMHDMDFFISESRTAEFCERIADLQLSWWALGRIDTLMQYSEATWRRMARSGLKMVFSGAESGTDAKLAAMNKGGKASASQTLALAARMKRHGIVPEFSFVLGVPPDPLDDVAQTFAFIRELKMLNPATEIILYTYTPVPMAGELYANAREQGFQFPDTLDEWASPAWQQLSMRRGDHIPWIEGAVRRRIRNFERVVNAFYPTITDPRLTAWRRALLRTVSAWRYATGVYAAPFELRALHRLMHYQRPETTGF